MKFKGSFWYFVVVAIATGVALSPNALNSKQRRMENLSIPVKTQFNVEMTCQSCVDSVKKILDGLEGITHYDINLEKEEVVVEGTITSTQILEAILQSGRKASVHGHGTTQYGSAVCVLDDYASIKGVVRFAQFAEDKTFIEVYITGLSPGKHGIHIHAYGDISDGDNTIGGHWNPHNRRHGGPHDEERHAGDLGNVTVDSKGAGSLRLISNQIKVADIIGRSMSVTENEDDFGAEGGNCGKGLVYGIIARSAGVGQNEKKASPCCLSRINNCEGVSL